MAQASIDPRHHSLTSPVVSGHGGRSQVFKLGLAEAALMAVALAALAYTTYDILDYGLPTRQLIWLVLTPLALTMAALISFGTYERGRVSDLGALVSRFAVACFLSAIIAYLLLYVLNPFWVSPLYAGSSAVVMFAVLLGARAAALYVADNGMLRRRILVIGDPEQALPVKHLCDAPGSGAVYAGRYPFEKRTPNQLVDYVEVNDIAEIVVVGDTNDFRLPMGALLDCKMRSIRVHDMTSFYERETGRVDLGRIYPRWFVFGDGFTLSDAALTGKRVIDIIGSACGLILLSPILIGAALAIKLGDGGPVFYRQVRTGWRGKPFEIIKFRSMRTDAEKFGAVWAQENDPRITKVGKILRKTRIDELPQLINILRGDMSIVGPRPERPVFVSKLAREIPFYDDRHRVKPGLTGWAQINNEYTATIDDTRDKLAYDLYYLKHFSLWLDFLIMLKTVRVVLWTDSAR
ncbi:MAG: TIGR03013 family PEP-CTERM/XrtA system glycosyltransferase [Neomegalonema sp.]|nr:TIGR03013 family PEP-CTERM/XrtA system glycosyltransferase [Neomegalonema sp.]